VRQSCASSTADRQRLRDCSALPPTAEERGESAPAGEAARILSFTPRIARPLHDNAAKVTCPSFPPAQHGPDAERQEWWCCEHQRKTRVRGRRSQSMARTKV
jgi:hypothetical protein